jgi:hypothetical protein
VRTKGPNVSVDCLSSARIADRSIARPRSRRERAAPRWAALRTD